MRIAVCGTHGIGKTTLVKELSNKLDLPHLAEQASFYLRSSHSFKDVEASWWVFTDFQRKVLHSQLAEEKENAETGFVADRTLVDSLAYVHVRTVIEQNFGSYLNDYKKTVLDKMVNRYDRIIFLRYDPHFARTSDNSIRNLNPVYMEEIDRVIDHYFEKELPEAYVLRLSTLDFEERVQSSLDFYSRRIICVQ